MPQIAKGTIYFFFSKVVKILLAHINKTWKWHFLSPRSHLKSTQQGMTDITVTRFVLWWGFLQIAFKLHEAHLQLDVDPQKNLCRIVHRTVRHQSRGFQEQLLSAIRAGSKKQPSFYSQSVSDRDNQPACCSPSVCRWNPLSLPVCLRSHIPSQLAVSMWAAPL